jgi:biotin synthesis protein BioG
MKIELINHDSTRLLIFFCGFYTDAACFADFDGGSSDILFVWDYSELNFEIFNSVDFTPYTEVNLVAYSYGVWAACKARKHLPAANKSVAIAGTPAPVDNTLGVSEKVFDLMLNALSWPVMEKFEAKMLDGKGFKVQPNRELENLRAELENIRALSRGALAEADFDHIILTKNDKIFPYRAQAAAWQGHRSKTELTCGHFPFFEFKSFDEILELA